MLVVALKSRKTSHWIWYAIFAALGMYTHLTMGFVLIGQFLAVLAAGVVESWQGRSRTESAPAGNGLIKTLIGFALAGVLAVLLYAPVIPQILNTIGGTEKSVVAEWKSPLWTVLEIIQGLEISFALWAVGLAALALLAAGMISYARSRPIVLGLFLLPPAIGAAVVIGIGHHLWPRFFFFAFGFGALVVVRGVIASVNAFAQIQFVPAWMSRLGLVACGLMILVSALAIPRAYGPKQDYEGALRFLEKNVKAGDAVVTVSLTDFPYGEYYRTGWESVQSLEDLEAIRSQARKTWVVYTFRPVLEAVHPDIMTSLLQEYELVQQFPGTVGEGTIYIREAGSKPSAVK
jgi:hypothetical protein